MKGIKLCGECGFYDWKKHKCGQGASEEKDATDPFYDDCPLYDVAPIEHARWIEKVGRAMCSACADECWADSAMQYTFCPNCGAKMDQEVDDNELC